MVTKAKTKKSPKKATKKAPAKKAAKKKAAPKKVAAKASAEKSDAVQNLAGLDRKSLAARARQLKVELLATRFNLQAPSLRDYRKKKRELASVLAQLG